MRVEGEREEGERPQLTNSLVWFCVSSIRNTAYQMLQTASIFRIYCTHSISLFSFFVLLQMTGHKRILSIVYARWPILPIVPIVLHRIIEKGHLIAGNMAARVMKGGNHKGGARKIKGNGF